MFVFRSDLIENCEEQINDSTSIKKTIMTNNKPSTSLLDTTTNTTSDLNSLLSQLIKINIKLFQDNFRLKKFCFNFKHYLEKEKQITMANNNNKMKTRKKTDEEKIATLSEEIYTKFDKNYKAIHYQFDDYHPIKMLLGI